MKKLFGKLKMMYDTYKMWIFLVALFGSNGMQAYMNDAGTKTKDITVSTTMQPTTKLDPITVVCQCSCQDGTEGHVEEHHGGVR